jgi:hypothetical protein
MNTEIVECCKCNRKIDISQYKCCDSHISIYDDEIIINCGSRSVYDEYKFYFSANGQKLTYTHSTIQFGEWIIQNGLICDDCILEMTGSQTLEIEYFPCSQ